MMNDGYTQIVTQLIEADEGKRSKLYDDLTGKTYEKGQEIKGKLTIGIGHNIEDNGLSDEVVRQIFREDLEDATNDCFATFPNWNSITVNRRAALASMMFNLGLTRFRKFHKLIYAVKSGDWQMAAIECLDSDAARKLPKRYEKLAQMIKGDYDV